MNRPKSALRSWHCPRIAIVLCGVAALLWSSAIPTASAVDAPVPLLAKGKPVDWWFIYKFNSKPPFNLCGDTTEPRSCPFGGKLRTKDGSNYSQQFAFASSGSGDAGKLTKGKGCVGTTSTDPLGATFDELYNGSPFFVIWNDQFYGDPKLEACGAKGNCDKPWGHSKGMLAWNEAGEGLVLQVTTPSWPAAGSKKHPRKAGNTLGCVSTQNNLNNAQHFFALKLDKKGVLAVLKALENSSVVTDPDNDQIARLGGPPDIRDQAEKLGKKSKSKDIIVTELAQKVRMISKPSSLNVPPWQMVSALLDGASERTATWWANPRIYSTTKSTAIKCWEGEVKDKKRGAVAIAKTGTWEGRKIGLIGGQNHAKIGVTTSGDKHYAIFGDLNQQGTINPVKGKCDSSQNGRGGLFFVVENQELFETVSDLLAGETAPTKAK